ncbi:MAG: zinc-binding dehydrogenase [Chloroflexi bacterium]|nr:MAG: zinc-binding dehydrogenase [Chloroflexota bacterium]
MTARALVLVAPTRLEEREFPLPAIGDADGLLRVEAAGICGTDVQQYRGRLGGVPCVTPVIPGHEIVGRVERAGADALLRWGVAIGDRVLVEEVLRCGDCSACATGARGCERMRVYGLTVTIDEPPGLWGGYSTHLYLAPTVDLHRVPDGVEPAVAVLAMPVANGLRWAGALPGTPPGASVVILGPGQQGLGCAVGALVAGAGTVIVVGRAIDHRRLEMARELGAHHTVDADATDPVAAVRELCHGSGADVVIDATAEAVKAVTQAIDMCATGGTVVLAGLKGSAPIPGLVSDTIVLKGLRILGAGGHDHASVDAALRLLASGRFPLERMATHAYPLAEAEHALRVVAREVKGEKPIHVSLIP